MFATRQDFEKERNQKLAFIEKGKDIGKVEGESIILISKTGSYVPLYAGEIVPARYMLVNPCVGDIEYSKVDSVPEDAKISSMCYNDPVRIWRNYKVGDIIKVESEAGVFYRRVTQNFI